MLELDIIYVCTGTAKGGSEIWWGTEKDKNTSQLLHVNRLQTHFSGHNNGCDFQ